jgi:hypothetical protein
MYVLVGEDICSADFSIAAQLDDEMRAALEKSIVAMEAKKEVQE